MSNSSSSDDSSVDVPLAALAGRRSENYHGDGSSSDDSSVEVVGAIPPTLLRLESNDPSLTQLRIPGSFIPAAGEWGRSGTAVILNTHLKELTLDLSGVEVSQRDALKFIMGVTRSTSLKKVHLHGCDAVVVLSRLSRMPDNLDLLELNQCHVPAQALGMLLAGVRPLGGGFSSVRAIKVNDTLQTIGGGSGLRDRGAPEKLLKTVAGHPSLKRLILCTGVLGGRCSSLALLLGHENDLVVLDLYNNSIGEGDVEKLRDSFEKPLETAAQLQSLVQTKGWQDIATILQGPHFRPAQLSFREDGTRENSDNLIVGLKSLNLGRHSRSVYFPHGWGQLYDLLQKPSCVLEDLDLSMGTQFSDEESSSLFDALKNNSSLKNLNLSGCLRKATSRTWNSISAMLEGDKTVLEKLNLCYSPVNNDAFYAFSCNLAVNDKMRELLLYNDPDWMTRWQPYARVLCNKTSIGHTFDSNHTLQRVVNNKRQPKGIKDLLERNQEENKFDVARQKVIDVHFPDGFVGKDPFVEMKLNVLPRALTWMARGGTRGQVDGRFWEFLKSQPTLFAGGNSKQSAKRKRED